MNSKNQSSPASTLKGTFKETATAPIKLCRPHATGLRIRASRSLRLDDWVVQSGDTFLGNRVMIVIAWSMLATQPVAASAQGGSGTVTRQTFEVASVRPSGPLPGAFSPALVVPMRVMPGGRFVASRASLEGLIRFAYALEDYESIDGGSSSLLKQRFDVNAASGIGDVPSTPPGVVGPMNVMVQSLLAERFRLRVRWEEPEQSVLVLVRARPDGKLGPGLRSSSTDCADPESRKNIRPTEATPGGCGITWIDGRLQAPGHRMSAFADFLSRQLKRPVFDRTNLEGTFAIDLTSSAEGIPPISQFAQARSDVPDPRGRPPLTTAIKEQLGLALEQRRERVRKLVIEHVEAPTPN